jgi:spore coat polysaccharide biosynthesis predicted glycosyltransferase SpsG
VERVLVATGSGEFDALGGELAHALAAAAPALQVWLVRGPDARGAAPDEVSTLSAPDSLLTPFLEADLVVTTGGQTVLEAVASGAPCVALPLVDNQRPQVAVLADAKALVRVDTPDEAVVAVGDLIQDGAGRRRLGSVGQATVDGYGALRIAFAIERLAEQPA